MKITLKNQLTLLLCFMCFLFLLPLNRIQAADEKIDATQIYAQCAPCMVEINVKQKDDKTALGSGFFIAEHLIATNYHVIRDAKEITICDYNQKEYTITKIISEDETTDYALIEVSEGNVFIPIANDIPKEGSTVYTIGSPYGFTGTFSDGIVSKASRIMGDDVLCHQISAPISRGNSGGPLLNEYGKVIGINSFTYATGHHINFAISIKEVELPLEN